MKKKVGIITSNNTFLHNYGAMLQAYALAAQIKLMGYDAIIIPYAPQGQQYIHQSSTSELIRKSLKIDKKLIKKVRGFYAKRKIIKNMPVFRTFVKERMPLYCLLSERKSFEQMKGISKDFYAFVCGSDQIWNPTFTSGVNEPGFFLDFAAEGVKRIAYAPSIGTGEFPDTAKTNLKEFLDKFDALSIRETSGSQIIKKVTGLQVRTVLDPTLLLPFEEWDRIVKKPVQKIPEKYILVYKFGSMPYEKKKIREISKRLKLPIVALPQSIVSYYDGFPLYKNIGPSEFIWLIRNATLVCTDSFHATVFSIINKTPFLTFYRDDPKIKSGMHGRMETLFELTGIKNRMVEPDAEINYKEIFNIDFQDAHNKILEERTHSFDYLKEALEK